MIKHSYRLHDILRTQSHTVELKKNPNQEHKDYSLIHNKCVKTCHFGDIFYPHKQIMIKGNV